MPAGYVSSRFIKTIQNGTKNIAVDFVDRTTAWRRPPGYPSVITQEHFGDVVRRKSETLKPKTVKVAMKESQHQSDTDKRMQYTAYELDKDDNVIVTTHLVDEKMVDEEKADEEKNVDEKKVDEKKQDDP